MPEAPRELVGLNAGRMSALAEQARAQLRDGCRHAQVIVDYQHPHARIEGVAVAQLRATPAGERPSMTLHSPRCGDSGVSLTRAQLEVRTKPGGDCHDPRFAGRGGECRASRLVLGL